MGKNVPTYNATVDLFFGGKEVEVSVKANTERKARIKVLQIVKDNYDCNFPNIKKIVKIDEE